MFSSKDDVKTSKQGRRICYQARDSFYECVKHRGHIYSHNQTVPDACKTLRAAYQAACLASWVKHFDEQQEQQARAAKSVHATINQRAATAAGGLAGKA